MMQFKEPQWKKQIFLYRGVLCKTALERVGIFLELGT